MKVKRKIEDEKDKIQNYQSMNHEEKHLLMKRNLVENK